jgi:hypothetical protein
MDKFVIQQRKYDLLRFLENRVEWALENLVRVREENLGPKSLQCAVDRLTYRKKLLDWADCWLFS